MNDKVVYGILNWNRPSNTSLIASLNPKDNQVIYCSNVLEIDSCHNIKADTNVAKSKNLIIRKARELKAKYLFIIEDDIIVKNNHVFQMYIDKMEEYGLGFIFYGFDRANMVLGMHNPGIEIQLNSEGDLDIINRFSCSSVLGFNLETNNQVFNETLLILEMEEYTQRLADQGIIPYNGLFFDIPNSWEYFDRLDITTERVKTMEIVKQDRQYINTNNINISPQLNADLLINFIIEKRNGK